MPDSIADRHASACPPLRNQHRVTLYSAQTESPKSYMDIAMTATNSTTGSPLSLRGYITFGVSCSPTFPAHSCTASVLLAVFQLKSIYSIESVKSSNCSRDSNLPSATLLLAAMRTSLSAATYCQDYPFGKRRCHSRLHCSNAKCCAANC